MEPEYCILRIVCDGEFSDEWNSDKSYANGIKSNTEIRCEYEGGCEYLEYYRNEYKKYVDFRPELKNSKFWFVSYNFNGSNPKFIINIKDYDNNYSAEKLLDKELIDEEQDSVKEALLKCKLSKENRCFMSIIMDTSKYKEIICKCPIYRIVCEKR